MSKHTYKELGLRTPANNVTCLRQPPEANIDLVHGAHVWVWKSTTIFRVVEVPKDGAVHLPSRYQRGRETLQKVMAHVLVDSRAACQPCHDVQGYLKT